MTVEEQIAAINFWQDETYFHPLTCGVKSSHEDLRGKERDGNVVLVCPTCGHEQKWIPGYVFDVYRHREHIIKARQQFPEHRNYKEKA